MRKITTLLTLMLICVVGAQAAAYTISVNASSGTFLRKTGETATSAQWAKTFISNGTPQVTIWTSEDEHKFNTTRTAFSSYTSKTTKGQLTWNISVEDGYIITGYKIVGTTNTGSARLTPSEGGQEVRFDNQDTYTLSVSGLATQSTTFKSNRTSTSSEYGDDVNISFTTYEIYVATPTTFKVMWDGVQVGESTGARIAGEPSLPNTLKRAFCTYTYNPATITDETTEVVATATWNGPFAISNSFKEASWYFIKSNAKETYLTYEEAATNNVAVNVDENNKADKLQWAFVGTPYAGFTIYNKAAGSDKILGSASGSTGKKYNKEAHCSMDAVNTRVSEKFYVNEAEGNFCLTDGSGYELNVRSDNSYLAYYDAFANASDAQANVFVAELASMYYPPVDIEVNTTNFDYFGSSGSPGNWASTLVAKETPEIRVEVRDKNGNLAGNVQANHANSATKFVFFSGQNAPSTYTISCPTGYELISYTLTHNVASDKTVTPTAGIGTIDIQDDGTNATINVTDINATEASFVCGGTNDGLVGTLAIRYHRVALPAYVTYIVYDNGGNEINRYEDIEIEAGTEISELPAKYRKAFMTYTYNGTVTATYGTTVTFSATEAGYQLPFKVSTDGNETWYILKAGNYYSYTGNRTTSYSGRNTNYYYAFFGNPETGFTIKNGNGKFITGIVSNSNQYSTPITLTDEGSVFTIEEADGGFRMYTPHQTVAGRDLYLGFYSGYTPFTVWSDLKLANDGILHAIPVGITDLSTLSNNKCYTLTAERGVLGTSNDALASTSKGFDAGTFAIINFSGIYYLYSVSDKKFVNDSGALTEDPTTVVTFTGNAPFLGKLGNNGINISSGYASGVVVNSWTTADQGNMYAIEEAGDFDPTEALAKLAPIAYNNIITALESYNYGTSLGQYGLTGSYAGYESQMTTIISGLKSQGYSADNLTIAQGMLDATELNMPAANTFLRIQSVNGANAYLKSAAAGTRETFTTTKDIETIFLLDDEGKLISYSTGIANNDVREAGTIGGAASLFTVIPAVSGNKGQYSLSAMYNGGTNYLYSTGVDGSNADRNTYASKFLQNNSFNLEAVTELPLTLKNCKTYLNISEDEYYTTLYLPVTVQIPSEVEVYTVTGNNGNSLNVEQVSDNIVPANTGVVLKVAPGTTDGADTYTVNATVSTNTSTTTSVLKGTAPAITAVSDCYVLSVVNNKLGFYKFAGENLNGFRAYYVAENADPTRGFVLNFGETTGVGSVVLGNNGNAYDLQGRRVNNAQKGVFIINGKKVVK